MRCKPSTLAALAAAALLAPTAAMAQAPACSLPETLPRPRAEAPTDKEPKRLLATAGYTLALSWSPEYCHAHARRRGDRIQCGGGNHFGFTLHGLWPDGPGKEWPQYCRAAELLPDAVIRGNLCTTPSPQLLQHEWAKHGTCVTTRPADYFAKSARLYRGIAYPDMAALSRKPTTVAAFAAAFASANKGLDANMIRLNVNRKGWLEEVWICLGTNLAPRRCPATAGGAESAASLKIERPTSAGDHQTYRKGRRTPRDDAST